MKVTQRRKYTPQEIARAKALILLLAKIDARRKAATDANRRTP